MTSRQRLAAVPDAPLRAVRMIRVSKERAEMISPDLQRTAIDDYCTARGYVVTAELEGLDESGSASRSPWWRKLEQAVGMVEARQADVIVVWKLSRAARHRRHWAVAVDRVEVAGGRLESATEQFDTATSTGRLARGMLAELAAWEAEVKGEQWRETHAHRLARGLPSSGSPRFGYAYRSGEGYEPDPVRGPLLIDLYRRYVAGEGFQALSMSLNAQGVATSRGGRWTPTTLMRLLDAGFAAGIVRAHDPACGCREARRCPRRADRQGAHEPLIDGRLWQAYLTRRKQLTRMPVRVRQPTYPLSGLVRCDCGASMTAFAKKGRPGYLYRCTGWQNDASCPGVWITRARVEAAVLAELRPFADEVDRRAAARTTRRTGAAAAKVARDRALREAALAEQAMTQLTVDRARLNIPEGTFVASLAQLEAERDTALAEADRWAVKVESLTAPVAARAVRGLLADWDTLPAVYRRDMVARLIASIRVYRDEAGRPQVDVTPRW